MEQNTNEYVLLVDDEAIELGKPSTDQKSISVNKKMRLHQKN